MLYLECSAIWLRDVDHEEERGKIPGKFRDVALEKNGKIKWSDKIRNEEVLRRVGEERSILKTIKKRKANWLGHILRRDCIQRRIMEDKIEGKRGRGRRKFGMLSDILKGKSYAELRDDAQDREKWRKLY
ncbi:hypothetical protein M8J77_025821 [Diaphorina citri]|nr:hypothetical protein M8J77_025821 [Diaphorina citri]